MNHMLAIYVRGGAVVGEGTFFYAPQKRPVDETSLPFIEIGNNCRVTSGVVILGHDYSYAVLRPIYNHMLRKCSVTKIGNNVFIGMKSIVLPGTVIGDNTIIGAGSVVSGNFPSNVIIGGNPAKVISTLDDYYEKNLKNFEEYARLYYQRMSAYSGSALNEDDMNWYCSLFSSPEKRKEIVSQLRVDGDNPQAIIDDIMKIEPKYDSFEAFITTINKE